MFAILSVLALAGSALAQNPNPCEGVTTRTTFVNDWASCRHYFWCNLDVAVPTFPCDDGFFFDEAAQLCRLGSGDEAIPDCLPCPDPDDATITPTTFAVRISEKSIS